MKNYNSTVVINGVKTSAIVTAKDKSTAIENLWSIYGVTIVIKELEEIGN